MIRGLPPYDPTAQRERPDAAAPRDRPSPSPAESRRGRVRTMALLGALAVVGVAGGIAIVSAFSGRDGEKSPAPPQPGFAPPSASATAIPQPPPAEPAVSPTPTPAAPEATSAGEAHPSVFCVEGRGGRDEGVFPASLVDPEGLLVAAGALARDSSVLSVRLTETRFEPATLVGGDPERGLALLAMTAVPGIESTPLHQGGNPAAGEPVDVWTCSAGGPAPERVGATLEAAEEGGPTPGMPSLRLDAATSGWDGGAEAGSAPQGGALVLTGSGELLGLVAAPGADGRRFSIDAAGTRDFLEAWKRGRAEDRPEHSWIERCEAGPDVSARRDCYVEALKVRPRMPQARYRLSLALGELGADEAQAEALEEVLSELPELMEARLDLIELRSRGENWKGAGEICTASLTVDAKDPKLLAVCSEVDRRLDRCYSAFYKANQAVDLDPAYARAYGNRALIHSSCLGRCDAALRDYRRYLDLRPKADDAAEIEKEIRRCEEKSAG